VRGLPLVPVEVNELCLPVAVQAGHNAVFVITEGWQVAVALRQVRVGTPHGDHVDTVLAGRILHPLDHCLLVFYVLEYSIAENDVEAAIGLICVQIRVDGLDIDVCLVCKLPDLRYANATDLYRRYTIAKQRHPDGIGSLSSAEIEYAVPRPVSVPFR